MAVILSDVLRVEDGETGLHFALRNRQTGYAEDTRFIIHKFSDGSVEKYPPLSSMSAYGQTGIEGYPGVTGLAGVPGATGAQGKGETGLDGVTGVAGVTGLRGLTGAQGVTGISGVTGLQGITGIIGATGSQGATGILAIGSWRVTDDGRTQRLMVNKTGGYLTGSWVVKQVSSVVENGIDYAEEDCPQPFGVVGAEEIADDGDPVWVTVSGMEDVRLGAVDTGGEGLYIAMSNTYSLANEGTCKATNTLDANTIGKCLEASSGVANIARCWINRMPVYGISGYRYLSMSGFSDTDEVLVYFSKIGNQITLTIFQFTGTSDSVNTLITGVPIWLNGTNNSQCAVPTGGTWIDGGSYVASTVNITAIFNTDSSLIELSKTGGWTNTGTKALTAPIYLSYHERWV